MVRFFTAALTLIICTIVYLSFAVCRLEIISKHLPESRCKCGFIGAGGGMMLLFVLTTFLGYEMHIAVGTSVFIMAFTAFTGGISHIVIGGLPDITALISCVVFTLMWAQIAAKIANKASSKTLNRVVGVVMIVTSVIILFVNYVLK